MTTNAQASAIRRIVREWREIAANPHNDRWKAHPLNPEEPYEWHFTIRGPIDSPFQGGIYHGRLVLPVNYPMAPPVLYFLTINGRFEVHKQVCLSATNFHPESWQPAWGISSILEALHAFFPSPTEGAVHSLDWSDAVRRDLAKLSVAYVCPTCNKSNLELITSPPPTTFSADLIGQATGQAGCDTPDQPNLSQLSAPEETTKKTVSPPPPQQQQPLPQVFNEADEFIKRQPTPSALSTAANSYAFMGFTFRGRGASLLIFLYWLIYFLGVETHSLLKRSRFIRDTWGALIGSRSLCTLMSPLVASLVLLGCIAAFIWASNILVRFLLLALKETFFLNVVPIHRIGQQTTAGNPIDLTIAEKYEDFPVSKWLVWLIYDE